jgi:hypothetical protein
MTIKTAAKTAKGSPEPRSAAFPALAGSTRTQPAHLGGTHMVVFDLVCAERQPLTARQIGQRMALSATEISEVLDELCQVRLLRRLKTVIESYTGPAEPFA